MPGLEAFMPDAFQGDAPVPRIGRAELQHQRFVGLQCERPDHVQVVGGGVGAAQFGRLGQQRVGLGQQLGLDGAVERGQLDDRPRHRGELFGGLSVRYRLQWLGVNAFDVHGRGIFGICVADVLAHHDR